jgi:tetratricopeptide (TPR) repeat protein
LALERRDWAAAARLELRRPAAFPWGDKYLYCDSITRFARAYGAVRAGNHDGARRELAELESLRGRIVGVIPGSYWATQADVQVLTITGWCALAEGRGNEAVAAMRRAVELESSTDKEAVTPGEVLPAGELLGEILSERGRFREALAAFEEQLTLSPNRLNGLAGAARAAELAGDSTTAARHCRELLAVAADADPGDDRVEHARTFLAGHSGTTVTTVP